MKRYSGYLLGIGAFIITVSAGRWGKDLFSTSEFVHFSINFPTVAGEPLLDRASIGGMWTRVPDDEWTGIPTGGLLAFGRQGRVVVDIGKRNFLKEIFQPNVLALSSHWIRNVGTTSRRICIHADFCEFKTSLVTFEKNWDPLTNCATRAIEPKELFNMDWIVRFPESDKRPIYCEGKITIVDQQTNKPLTVFPITIKDSSREK